MSRLVELKDQSPLVIQKDEMDDDVVAVCRCGLSSDWPYCDGTHAKTQSEDDDEIYAYRRPDGQIEGEEVEVEPGRFDPRS